MPIVILQKLAIANTGFHRTQSITSQRIHTGVINMKKEAKLAVKNHLINEQNNIRADIRRNKSAMKRLVEEQTILKRKLPILHELIKNLD